MSVRKKRAPKTTAYSLAKPVSSGTILSDVSKSQWIVGKPIAQGGFGCIYSAKRAGDASENYIVKIEPKENGPLFTEVHFYIRVCTQGSLSKWINQHKLSFLGIPRHVASGLFAPLGQPECRFLIMDRYTGDLESALKQARLTSDQVPLIAYHVLNALEYLHSRDYAHADIKAANLLYKTSLVEVTLVDFGLVHLFRINGKHAAAKPDPKFKHNGTLEFCSRDAHRGLPPSARGDLEILLFNVIHWLARCRPGASQSHTTGLPWGHLISDPKLRQNVSDSVKNQVAAIKEQTMKNVDSFFSQTGFPHDAGLSFALSISQLDYDETPDYEGLRRHLLTFSKRLKSSVTASSRNIPSTSPLKRPSTEHPLSPVQQSKTVHPANNCVDLLATTQELSKRARRRPPGSTSRRKKVAELNVPRATSGLSSPVTQSSTSSSSRCATKTTGGVERGPYQSPSLSLRTKSPAELPTKLPPCSKRPGLTELPTRSSPRIRAMKESASSESNLSKSLRDIFSDSEEEFTQPISQKVTEPSKSVSSKDPTLVGRKVFSPHNPPTEFRTSSSSVLKSVTAATPTGRQSGFCQTSPELLLLARAEALGRRAAALADRRHQHSTYFR